jgi:hypothetical protein
MSYDNSSMKHAITSLISVISSTLRGVEYLISRNNMVYFLSKVVMENVIKIMKQQEHGNVI